MFSLYRFYNDDDVLLYVGMSFNAIHRFLDHRTKTSWFNEIAKVLVKRFDTKAGVLAAEGHAIITEKPLYNKLIPRKVITPKVRSRKENWIVIIKKEKAALNNRVTTVGG